MKRKTKIIAALDSFKGAVSSFEAGCAVKRGITERLPDCEVMVFPLGDGGEGTSAAFADLGIVRSVTVSDTHRDKTEAHYVLFEKNGKRVGVFDMAEASGLALSRKHGLDIAAATTAGVGELIVHLKTLGCDEIIVGLGGSGTNDGGIGALARLGVRLYDRDGAELDGTLGAVVLSSIASCDLSPARTLLDGISLTLLYDADVMLTGESGATDMFSRQKGASDTDVVRLENAMRSFAEVGDRAVGYTASSASGCGAAGGLGYGLSLVGGTLRSGAEYVLDLVGFREAAADADLVITGEGKTDRQTARGKLPLTVARYAGDVPTVCLCGTFEFDRVLFENGFDAVFSIVDSPMTLEASMKSTLSLLEKSAYSIAGLYAAITNAK